MTKQEISFYDKGQVDGLLSDKADTADLAAVAFSGDYDDLSDKPALNFLPLTGGSITGSLSVSSGVNTSNMVASDYNLSYPRTASSPLKWILGTASNNGTGWLVERSPADILADAKALINQSTGTGGLEIMPSTARNQANAVSIKGNAEAEASVAILGNATGYEGIAIGRYSSAAALAVQLGRGSAQSGTFCVGVNYTNYMLLDSSGIIPDDRLKLKTINGNSIKGTGDLSISGNVTLTDNTTYYTLNIA